MSTLNEISQMVITGQIRTIKAKVMGERGQVVCRVA